MASGDADAATAFVRRYQARVYGLAFTIVGVPGLAEDVAQEAFVRAWRHAETYDVRKGRVATWLLTITRNLAVDAVRLRRERPVDPGQLAGLSGAGKDSAERPGISVEDVEQLRAALRTLPEEQSRAIVLSVFYALTAKEIAEVEHIPVGTAKTRLRRGLVRLRDALGVTDD
ncbi:MAG: RNA polymerase sigma factor [Streptomycetales bacterium]